MEEFKVLGACALNDIKGFGGCAKDRVVFFDMANIRVVKVVNQRTSKSPVKEKSSNIRALRDGD